MSTDLANWESEYSLGVAEIDAHHQELLNFVNDLINNSAESQIGRSIYFKKIIDAIINHMTHYFGTEEKILANTKYEKLTDHKKEHERITEKIIKIRSEIGNEKEEMALYNLTVTLKEYFLSHILLYDKEARDFFREGAGKPVYS